MADVFEPHGNGKWSFTAQASTVLAGTSLASAAGVDGTRYAAGPMVHPQHDAAYWEAVTAGFDFTEADQVPPEQFNRILWDGLMGGKPYPVRAKRGDRGTTGNSLQTRQGPRVSRGPYFCTGGSSNCQFSR